MVSETSHPHNSVNLNNNETRGSEWFEKIQESVPLKHSKDGFHERFEQLRQQAVAVTLTSLFFNLTLAFSSVVLAVMKNSASTSAFAADCVLDVLSSAIVLWRYCGSNRSLYMSNRERKACIYLGIMFIVSGAAVVGKAVADLITKKLPASIDAMLYLATAAFVICLCLSIGKLLLYRNIKSESILLDAINSFTSSIFAIVVIMTDLVIHYDLKLWFLDPAMSIVLSLSLALYGVKVIYANLSTISKDGYFVIP